MAIGSFGRALGQIAKESVTGSVKGFASGVKGAFLSEMPAVTSAYGFAKDVRSRMGDQGTNVVAKEQRTGNLISLEMVRQLKQINFNVLRQTMFSSQQAKAERLKGMFAEEIEREKSLRDNALLNAIKDIGKNFKFGGKSSTTEGGGGLGLGPRLLTSIVGGAIGALLGKGIASVLAALAIGVKAILSGIAALAARLGLSSLGGLGRNIPKPIPKGPSARTQPRIPKGQPGAGRFTKVPKAATGIRAGFAATGAALRTNPWTFALGAGLLIPEVLEMMGYDPYGAMANFFFPSAQGAINRSPSTTLQNDPGYVPPSAGGSTTLSKTPPLSVRQNNPGNLRAPGATTGFRSFSSPEEGMAALHNQLRLYITGKSRHGKRDTIASIISVYAPSSENQTGKYIDFVSAKIGKGPNEKLTVSDIPALAKAITQMEGGAEALAYFYGRGKPSSGGGRPPPVAMAGLATAGNIGTISTGNTSAGGGTAVPTLTIPKVHDPIAEKKAIEANKFLKSISKSSGITARETRVVGNHYRPTRRIKTPQEKAQEHFEKAQENLLNTIDRTLTKFFGATLTDALIPSGYGRGVTAAQASRTGFIGETIGRATGIDKKVSSALTKVFGKEYGQMLAPSVSSLGKAYVNKLGVELGTTLFANTMGSNEAAAAITGQIVGNFAKGNKQMAMEQMLYAFTGMPTGPETIAAHYGFSSAAQGIQHIAEYGAATITNQIQGMTGMAGRPQRLPNMPTAGYGGLRGPTTLGTGVNANIVPHKTQADINKYGLVGGEVGDATLKQAEITENLYSLTGTAHKEGISVSKDNTTELKFNAMDNTDRIVTAIKTQPRGGGGTTIGGNFMGDFGNFLMDMGTNLVVSKLTSGIKNPYLRAIANFGGSYAMRSFITPTIAKSLGFNVPGAAGVSSTSLAMQGGGIGSNVMSGFNTFQTMGPAYMMSNALSSFMPSMYSIGASIGGSTLGSTFSQFGSGFTYGATPYAEAVGAALGNTTAFAAGQFAAKALPYADAIIKLFKGDIKAAATSAALTYIGFSIAGPIGAAIGSFISNFFGGSKPKPTMARAIYVMGNNDISKKFTLGTRDIDKQEHKDAFQSLLDAYLNIAFNATKTIQARTKMTPSFYAIVFEYRSGAYLEMKLYGEGETLQFQHRPARMFDYGDPGNKDFKAGSVAKSIVKHIEDQFTKGKSESEIANVQLATKEVTSQTFMDLTSGLSSRIKDLEKQVPISQIERSYADAQKQMYEKPMSQELINTGDSYELGPRKFFYNPVTGKYEEVADPDNTLYIDAKGRPVIDVGQKGFSMEDLIAHYATIQHGNIEFINIDQSQNDSSTNVNSNGTMMGPPDPDSMAAASSGSTHLIMT